MVAAPMAGLEPEDIVVDVTADGRLVLHGDVRGLLKEIKELLQDEWSVGAYHRELTLPMPVNAMCANVTYGNGVLLVALPISEQTLPAHLVIEQNHTDTRRAQRQCRAYSLMRRPVMREAAYSLRSRHGLCNRIAAITGSV